MNIKKIEAECRQEALRQKASEKFDTNRTVLQTSSYWGQQAAHQSQAHAHASHK